MIISLKDILNAYGKDSDLFLVDGYLVCKRHIRYEHETAEESRQPQFEVLDTPSIDDDADLNLFAECLHRANLIHSPNPLSKTFREERNRQRQSDSKWAEEFDHWDAVEDKLRLKR